MSTEHAIFVVTRPAPDHVRMMRKLGDKGLVAVHNPAFRLESEPVEVQARRLDGLGQFDLAIVTSPMAARLVAARVTPVDARSVRFIAPGAGTASILETAGIPAARPETGGTSEDILAMPRWDGNAPGRVAIVGAPGGRGLLAREFTRRGAEVVPIHLYCRVPVAPNPAVVDALGQGAEMVVMISSRHAFEMILNGLPPALRAAWLGASFVVSSVRMAGLCRDTGAQRVWTASGASDEALLTAALATRAALQDRGC